MKKILFSNSTKGYAFILLPNIDSIDRASPGGAIVFEVDDVVKWCLMTMFQLVGASVFVPNLNVPVEVDPHLGTNGDHSVDGAIERNDNLRFTSRSTSNSQKTR